MIDEYRIKIGEELQKVRNHRGLSLRELAEQSGITYSNISKIENGKYNVSIDILSKLCRALNAELLIKDLSGNN